jgi:hypothetical protein
LLALTGRLAFAQTSASEDFEKYARELRDKALQKLEPAITVPTVGRAPLSTKYPWKNQIVTTTFWVRGLKEASAWDADWGKHFGGIDDPNPKARRGFIPAAFTPEQNPFYCALPYNDVARGRTKPEARTVIPWFREAFEREGGSVCRDHWVRIRNRDGKDCYAQWSDCGPHRADHWQYVFGNERPKPNASQGAGLGVSPAVRDFLSLSSTDVTDWQFVDFHDVPRGPWALYGENNPFVLENRPSAKSAAKTPLMKDPAPSPRVISK